MMPSALVFPTTVVMLLVESATPDISVPLRPPRRRGTLPLISAGARESPQWSKKTLVSQLNPNWLLLLEEVCSKMIHVIV